MSFRKFRMRAVSLVMAFVFIGLSPAVLTIKVGAKTLEELQAESERLQKLADALNKTIRDQEKNLTNQQAYLNALDQKIDNTLAQIKIYDDQIEKMEFDIESLNQSITEKEAEIAKKEKDIEDRLEALRQRLRAISKTGNFSVLQMIMDTESYVDFLIKQEMMERVAKRDKELIDELEAELVELNLNKDELEKKKEDVSAQLSKVAGLKKQAGAKKAELEVDYAKRNAQVIKTKNSLSANRQDLERAKRELEELNAKITQIIQQSASSGRFGGGTMFWPVPAVRNISSYFGPRWNSYHYGIDIANGSVPVYGQNIVAAYTGTVIYVNTTDSWGLGYGYYLIIDHGIDSSGKKISTLYAHCSQILARVGDKVVGGKTVIAKVGRTGNVTGPHLHFEVRENGKAVDPIGKGYIKKNW